jgi:RNA polymerase sigma factor (sigma-70 family)
VETHRESVYRFLLTTVGPNEADDCFQETFLAALRAYPRLESGDRLDRWILKIASNKALDGHRRRLRSPMPVGEVPDVAGAEGEPRLEAPDHVLWKAVAELPHRQRTALVLRHVLDRSYEDIADVMGGSDVSARANVYQGLKKLRELIA